MEIQVSDSLFAMKIGGVRTILISAEDQQLANAKASPRDLATATFRQLNCNDAMLCVTLHDADGFAFSGTVRNVSPGVLSQRVRINPQPSSAYDGIDAVA